MSALTRLAIATTAEERAAAIAEVCSRMLETAGALELAERQSRESRLLAMVNERLHKSLDRRELLAGITEGVRAAFDADRCIVYERGASDARALVVAEATSRAPLATSIAIDGDLRKVFSGLTLRRERLPERAAAYGDGARSAIAMPFIVDGRVEDAMLLVFNERRTLDDSDVGALRVLAFHVGLALSNTRLYERERARRRQAETLERVVRILRDTQYVDEVLLVFVVTVSHELGVDCAAYGIEDERLERRAVRLRETSSFTPEASILRAGLEQQLSLEDPSDAELLPADTRRALFGEAGGVLVALRTEARLWGAFIVRSDSGLAEWAPEDRATFFRTLGSHLEIALTNAYAYERELRRAQERETLAEAARTILSHTALRPLADVMCRFAATLVHADRTCVLRWDGASYERVGMYGQDIERTLAASGFDLTHRAQRPAMTASTDDRRVQRLTDGPGYVVIPLSRTASDLSGDTIDAFLIVGSNRPVRFARDDLRLLQELGALLALALRNLDLYEAMQRANRALHESNEFKDDLLAMLAHDFKGPLTVILGYCELLLEAEHDVDEVKRIFEQTNRLVRLSEDALILAQTQSEGFSLARNVVDLGAFVARCVHAVAGESARVTLELPAEPVSVSCDGNRFRHVIDNVVQNALKYSEGPVHVAVHAEGNEARIDVTDRGIGIPRDELTALFTRFGRASNARRRGIAGSGVGLYISKKIVDAHRGTVSVRSIEDEGTTFTVALPLARAEVEKELK
ncbi:MAG TPA: ATP-binding protein [Candidatus Dormibacteraeota bacterium]|nr:ATP-binding protein [Candidatus Dormibacteraeota bacterium]